MGKKQTQKKQTELVNGGITPTKVVLAPIDKIISYQIIEHELTRIESGFDGGVILNIAVASASSALSLLITAITANFEVGSVMKPVLLSLSICLLVFCVIFFVLYYRSRKEASKIFEEIRLRKGNISLSVFNHTNEAQQQELEQSLQTE